MPTKQPKTARATHANRGVEAAYRKAIQSMVREMADSFEYWITAAYRAHPPRVADLAEDAKPGAASKAKQEWATMHSPSAKMRKVLRDVGGRWIERFNTMSETIAMRWLESMRTASEASFKAALRDAGWSVKFEMTPAMRDALNAQLAENVALIKSIPEEYLKNVEGAVMRSYARGRDLENMVKDIKRIYPVTNRRAELIARDQSNKANAVVSRTRQMELGITEAVWMHSHAGKNPRPSHVAANGKRYKIAQGCLIDGEYIYPGQEINCRCTSRPILPF